MKKGLILMAFTAGGALLGFRVVDGYREAANREKAMIVQAIIDDEKARAAGSGT